MLLKTVKRWLSEGRNVTLVGAPGADILREAIELLQIRIEVGASTFLVTVKEHRGEPANAGADIQANNAISDESVLIE